MAAEAASERSETFVRWSWIGGLVFVVGAIVGLVLLGTPDPDAADSEWADYFSDSGNRVQLVAAGYLWIISGLGFLVFAWGLRERLHRGERAITSMLLPIATVVAVAFAIAGVAIAVVAGSVEFADAALPSGEISRMFEQIGLATLLLPGMLSAALFTALAGIVVMRGDVFPRWVGVSAFVCAVVLLFSPLFFPAVAILLWVLAVSLYQAASVRSDQGV